MDCSGGIYGVRRYLFVLGSASKAGYVFWVLGRHDGDCLFCNRNRSGTHWMACVMTALTEHDREALVKRIERIEAFRREQFIPQAGDAEYGEPWQLEHNEILAECCDAAIAALTAQSGEQTAVAWLICRADGSRDVVLSPLTDDTPMDYGDEAWPLVHQSSMPDSTDGQTADTVSVLYGYGIVDKDGKPWWGEVCVSDDEKSLQDVVDALNSSADSSAPYPYRVASLIAGTSVDVFTALIELGRRIEVCGASAPLTHAVTLCSDLRAVIGNKHNPADKYAAERVKAALAAAKEGK